MLGYTPPAATAADGTHPTGMHSCFQELLLSNRGTPHRHCLFLRLNDWDNIAQMYTKFLFSFIAKFQSEHILSHTSLHICYYTYCELHVNHASDEKLNTIRLSTVIKTYRFGE